MKHKSTHLNRHILMTFMNAKDKVKSLKTWRGEKESYMLYAEK